MSYIYRQIILIMIPKEKAASTVEKKIKEFAMAVGECSPVYLKTENFTYSDFFENKMLIIHAIRKGLPYSLFEEIQKVSPFSENDWAEFLAISVKTLQRNKKEDNFYFKPIHSEKIIELAEVTQFGKEVFDSTEKFYQWLKSPSHALGNLKPMELLKDSYGKELVMEELNRIEHGIFA